MRKANPRFGNRTFRTARKGATPKILHYCEGGPYDGLKIYLTRGQSNTLEFSCGGFKGRYVAKQAGRNDATFNDENTVIWVES